MFLAGRCAIGFNKRVTVADLAVIEQVGKSPYNSKKYRMPEIVIM